MVIPCRSLPDPCLSFTKITILFYFTFPFIKYKHCNIVTILSVRGRLILSTCTALSARRLVFYFIIPHFSIFTSYFTLHNLILLLHIYPKFHCHSLDSPISHYFWFHFRQISCKFNTSTICGLANF